MKGPAKPRRRRKDLRFWPHHRLELEQLERRFYPGTCLDVLGWTLMGSGLAFLSWERLAAALDAGREFADFPGIDPCSHDVRWVTVPEDAATLSLEPWRVTYAGLGFAQQGNNSLTTAGRETAPGTQGQSDDSAEPAAFPIQKTIGWNWLGDPFENEWDTPTREKSPTRLSDTEETGSPWRRGGDGEPADSLMQEVGAAPAFPGLAVREAPAVISAPPPAPGDSLPSEGSVQPPGAGPRGKPPALGDPSPLPSKRPLDPTSQRLSERPALQRNYLRLPLSFEPNRGQSDPSVQFLGRGQGYNLFFTASEAVLILHKPVSPPQNRAVVRMQLVGSNPAAVLTGQGQLPGVTNYFQGNDPTKWYTNVPNYSQVAYRNVYPGIDLLYYEADRRQLEFDFVVAPGVSPAAIQLSYQGSGTIRLDTRGHLIVPTASGDLVQRAPVVYQVVDGVRRRVIGQHVLQGSNRIGFQIGPYDTTRPLYIDPVISYSTFLGPSDSAYSIAVDASGNAYVTGTTQSLNFPTAGSPFQPNLRGGQDAFVSKLDPTGTRLIYSTYLGGSRNDQSTGIAVDADGNAYVSGFTFSRDFPTRNAFQSTNRSTLYTNAFVTKLNPSGSALVYSTFLGGTSSDTAKGIAVDADGNAYVTGFTSSNNFPALTYFGTPRTNGTFVTKFGPTGTRLYSDLISDSAGYGIAVDSSRNAYVTGSAAGNFPTTPGVVRPNYGGGSRDAFVAKLHDGGSALDYATFLGGGDEDIGFGIAVDRVGGAYVTGVTHSTDFPTSTNAFQHTSGGGNDAFVTKLNNTATTLVYSTYLGGSAGDSGSAIAVNSAGEAYVTGTTWSTNFPTAIPVQPAKGAGPGKDAFVSKLNADGSGIIYSTYLGGNGDDAGNAIALDPAGNAYVAGYTDSSDFPVSVGAFQTGSGGDGFVTKLGTPPIQRLNDTGSTWLDVTTASVAPNTSTLHLSQPLDIRQSPDSPLDGFAGLGVTPALVYNSDSVNVRPIGEVTPRFDPALGTPINPIQLELYWNNSSPPLVTSSFAQGPHTAGDPYLLAAQLPIPPPLTATGLTPWRFHVHADFQSRSVDLNYSDLAQTVVTDSTDPASLDNSAFGPGWSLAGLNRLIRVTDGVFIVFGTGVAGHFFLKNVDGSFTSPPNDFGTLSQAGPTGTYTYTSKDQVQWTFDYDRGLQRTVTDPHQLVATFTYTQTYDNSHTERLLSTIQLPDGAVTTFLYDAGNLLTSISEPGSRTVAVSRNGRDLASITNPDGTSRTFTYDGQHHLKTERWGPVSVSYSYDANASMVNAVDWGTGPTGPTTLVFKPSSIEGLTTMTAQSPPAVAVVTDANTNTNTYTLDYLGRITQLDRPGIPSETWQRDQAGQVTVYTDANSNVTTNTYDYTTTTQTYQYGSGNGDLTRIDYPDGNNQQFKYESMYHHLTQRQDQRGKFTTFLYDSLGNLTGTRDANQNLTQQSWNGAGPFNGLLSSVTDANNHMTTYQWSSDGTRRLMGMTEATGYPESRFTTYLYDAAGNATSVTTGQSNNTTYAHMVTTTFLYDGMRRVTSSTEGNGARTTSKLYDAVGNVTQTTDAAGRITSFSYDNRNHLIQTDEAVGTALMRSTTFLYDGAGNLLAETHGISPTVSYDHHVTTSYGYDALNRRTSAIEGFGGSPSRTTGTLYDAVGNVTQITDANSHVSQFLYDALNRKTVTIDATPAQNRTTTLYDAAGNVTSVQAALNRLTTYSYDNLNRRTEVTEGAADATVRRATTTLYDAVGNVTGVVYPRQFGTPTLVNLRTTFLYDALNRQTAMYDQAGQLSTTAYDATGNVTITTDMLQRQTTFLYDALNQRVETTEAAQLAAGNPLRRITTTAYDAVGNVTGVYSPAVGTRNTLTSYLYDALNRKTVTVDPAYQRTTTLYDAMGNVTGSYDEATRLTTFLYDSLNQRAQTTEAAGTSLARITTTLYDAVGNVTETMSPAVDASGVRLTTYLYDNMNRRTEVTESAHLPASNPAHRTTTTLYDALGNTTAVIDPDGNQTGYLFDALNRQTVTISPNTGNNLTTTLYDAADNVTQMTDRDNRIRQFSYDALNRRTNETWPATGALFTYSYNAGGELIAARDAAATYTYVPDALGRATSITSAPANGPPVVLNENFDAQDERTNVSATVNGNQDFTTSYNYDAVGRMTYLLQTGPGVTNKLVNLFYNPDSQLATITRYSDAGGTRRVATTAYDSYDALGRLTQLTNSTPSMLIHYSYGLDIGDRLTQSVSTLDGTMTYGNDADDEESSVTYTDGQAPESYAYDHNGNRSSGGSTPGADNRLLSDATYNYGYDPEGNRTSRLNRATQEVTSYIWDPRNRLAEVVVHNAAGQVALDALYTYDAFDRRIAKSVNGALTEYSCDGDQIDLAFAINGATATLTHRYLYGPMVDELFTDERVNPGGLDQDFWPLTDNLGTVRDEVDDNGLLQDHVQYDSFGNMVANPLLRSDFFFAFQGREWDAETKQYSFRARIVDPFTGTFPTQDPAVDGTNPYEFVGNDPTGATDPSGQFQETLFWRNVEKLAPGAQAWWQGEMKGRIVQEKPWFRRVTGSYENGGTTSVMYLDPAFNEIEAAQAFIDYARDGYFGAYWAARSLTLENPRAGDEWRGWYQKQIAGTTLEGARWLGTWYSLTVKGADWAITISDAVNKNLSALDLVQMAAFLPIARGSKIKVVDKKTGKVVREIAPQISRVGKAGKIYQVEGRGPALTIDVTKEGWARSPLGAPVGGVYIVRNKATGELLKVGKTDDWPSRFREYRAWHLKEGLQIDIDFYEVEAKSIGYRRTVEDDLRKFLRSEGHSLPRDLEKRN